MGCKNSTTKTSDAPSSSGQSSPRNNGSDAARNVSAFLGVVTVDFEAYLEKQNKECNATMEILARVFLNSCVDVVHNNFRMKSDVVVSTVKRVCDEKQLGIMKKASADIEEHAVDDGLSRLLNAWLHNNKEHKSTVDAAAATNIMKEIDVYISSFEGNAISFTEMVRTFYDFHFNEQLEKVFLDFSENADTMSDVAYCKFLNTVQGTTTTSTEAHEKIRSRFGGAMTKYSFCTYISRAHSNFILDPQRSRDIWQDMMEPLPNYMVRTQTVLSTDDLTAALAQGVRAFVLQCAKDESGSIVSGTIPLRTILETLKGEAFVTNNYPVILCLDPSHIVAKEVQETIASEIQSTIGSQLARGMMFDGANINDPQYSPAALQKKFLLMGTQAPLKPFVGFLVADMNRVGLGVRVTDVKDGTPAAKAGIVKDDWLTHINGEPIKDKQHLKEHLVNLHLGEEFTMKKENLEEVRVVVGGAIPEDDRVDAKHLSDLIYLKFCDSYNDIESNAPWEASTVTSQNAMETPKKREALQNHLVYISDAAQNESTDENTTTDMSNMGVQFLDNSNSEEIHTWSLGKFAENAHCGYVLKSCDDTSKSSSFTIKFLSAPQHIRNAKLTKVESLIYGKGDTEVNESSVTANVLDESSVAVFKLTYELDGTTHELVGSFPAHLIRIGYRGMPVLYTNTVLHGSTISPYDVLCYVEANKS